MKYFLLDYDHAAGEVTVSPIEDTAEALSTYSLREREALGSSHEVVLFYGESEDHLRKTHSRYFLGPRRVGEPIEPALTERLERLWKLIARSTEGVTTP